MEPTSPAEPSAPTPPRAASGQFLVSAVRVTKVIAFVAIACSAIYLALFVPGAVRMHYEVAARKANSQASGQSQIDLADIKKAVDDIRASTVALEHLKEQAGSLRTGINRLEGRVDALASAASLGQKADNTEQAKEGAQEKNVSTTKASDSPVVIAVAKPARTMFVRIDDKEIASKDAGTSADYALPAGKEHASRRFSLAQIKEGRVAVSRNPGLRALVTWPPAKKIGLIPDWRIYGLVGSGNTVEDVAVPVRDTDMYVEFKQWAGAKSVRFYWTDVTGAKDPLLIKFYKE